MLIRYPEEAPFHTPVFVVTHEKRDPWERPGGLACLVNDGIEHALDQAREAAGDRDVRIAGGGATILEHLNAGLVDEFSITLSPVLFAPAPACSTGWTRPGSRWSRSVRGRRRG
ncbi:dihydrofolate reductase family protein [Streptomyces sp. NPDC058255]|uniref:dihydrofolate reductase family protein n=1 Tax=Streptomyces sp. NPDC058255 TaxID=3346407 RepID=UPI0036E985EC